jgi:hypothetical protein
VYTKMRRVGSLAGVVELGGPYDLAANPLVGPGVDVVADPRAGGGRSGWPSPESQWASRDCCQRRQHSGRRSMQNRSGAILQRACYLGRSRFYLERHFTNCDLRVKHSRPGGWREA